MSQLAPLVAGDNEEVLFASFEKLGDFSGLQHQFLDRLGALEPGNERQQQVGVLLSRLKSIVRAPVYHDGMFDKFMGYSSMDTKSKLISWIHTWMHSSHLSYNHCVDTSSPPISMVRISQRYDLWQSFSISI
jgi:hypothetical protein